MIPLPELPWCGWLRSFTAVFLQVVWGRMRPARTGWWRTLVLSRPWPDCRTFQRSTWLSAAWVTKVVFELILLLFFLSSKLCVSWLLLLTAGGSTSAVSGSKGWVADATWGGQFGQCHPNPHFPQSTNRGLQPETHRLSRRGPQLDISTVPLNDTQPAATTVYTQWPQRGIITDLKWNFTR